MSGLELLKEFLPNCEIKESPKNEFVVMSGDYGVVLILDGDMDRDEVKMLARLTDDTLRRYNASQG